MLVFGRHDECDEASDQPSAVRLPFKNIDPSLPTDVCFGSVPRCQRPEQPDDANIARDDDLAYVEAIAELQSRLGQ